MSSNSRALEVELEVFCWHSKLDTRRTVAQVHSPSGETLQSSDGYRQDQPPLSSPLQQVHHAVRNHIQHRERPAIGLAAAASSKPVHCEPNICPTTINTDKRHLKSQLISTRVASSTADVHQALRQLAAVKRDHNQRARFISVGATPSIATAFGQTRRRSKRRSELSPCRMATTKIKSTCIARKQDKLRQIERDDPRMAHFRDSGNQLGKPQGGGQCGPWRPSALALASPMKVTPDGEMPDGERRVGLDESCSPIGLSERAEEVGRSEFLTSNGDKNKFAVLQDEESSPIESYANGQCHKEHSVGSELSATLSQPLSFREEVPNRTDKDKTIINNQRDKQPNQADMTTESFVPTDSIGQHISSNNSNSKHDETRHQQQQHQYNIISQQQHSARPIGLACSTSSCSLTSSDNGDDDDQDQQVSSRPIDGRIDQLRAASELVNGDSNNNKLANNMKPADERYTVISASSMVSLSGEQHYGQSYVGGRGGGSGALASSSSTNAINQSRAANGGKNLIGKLVGKKASRIRELVLQNLGRADRTTDELFDLYEMNFYKQQQHVQQLTKEFKLYINALKSYHEASRSLSKCIQQSTSDYQLARHDLVCDNLSQLDQLNEDLMEKLQEKVVKSLGDYLTRFDEIKEKINKRHRKLIDYDSSRRLYELMFARVSKKRSANTQQQQPPQHNYQSILRGIKFLSQQQPSAMGQHNPNQESVIASQLVDEARLLKLREQFNYCKLMYENINGELQDELPVVYETKMKSLLNALQNYYEIRAHHHSNASKLIAKVSDVMTVANGQSVSDETNTILSMYDDGADEKSSSAGREMNSTGPGSGSSGVSVSGSASRSSGSSLASPDCDGQRSGQADDQDGGEDESADDDNNQQQRDSKNEHRPADLNNSVRQFVEVSLESVGKQDDEPPQVAPSGDAVACEQVSVGLDSAEEQTDTQSNEGDQDIKDDNEAGAGPGNDESNEVGSVEVGCEINKGIAIETGVDAGPGSLIVKSRESPITGMGYNDSDATAAQKEYLYRVRTNYKYLAEDVDELCFEANEIIQVIEFDESHEPEDGWLLGIREVNNQRGLFPANFTQPI